MTAEQEQIERLRIALQKCAGALMASADGRANITFNGEFSYLGRMTVNEILDEANQALELTRGDR